MDISKQNELEEAVRFIHGQAIVVQYKDIAKLFKKSDGHKISVLRFCFQPPVPN